jgi:hypothetical protein
LLSIVVSGTDLPSFACGRKKWSPFGGGAVGGVVRAEAKKQLVRDLARRVAAEHHSHRAANAPLAAAHRGETGHRRDVHFIAFLGAGRFLRRAGNGGEHRGDRRHGNETQTRTHRILPVAEDAPADDATRFLIYFGNLYARESRTPSEGGHRAKAIVAAPD